MKQLFIIVFAVFCVFNLKAQVVEKVPSQSNLESKSDSAKVVLPIGEVQDTVYLRGVLAQEKEPLKVERFMAITRTYVFTDSKFNKPIEQWFEKVSSALTPNSSSKRITDFQKDVIWYQVLSKPK